MNEANYTKRNDILTGKLSAENRKYFSELRGYMHTKSLFIREEEVDKQLYGILGDLLEAQKHGETAEDYLGQKPQNLADDLLSRIPKETLLQRFKRLLPVIIYCIVILYLFGFMRETPLAVNPALGIFVILTGFLIVWLPFSLAHRLVYNPAVLPKKKYQKFLLVFFLSLLFFALQDFVKTHSMIFRLDAPADIVLATFMLVVLIASGMAERKLRTFLPAAFIMYIFGLSIRLPALPDFWKETPGLIIRTLAVLGIFIFVLKRNHSEKKKN